MIIKVSEKKKIKKAEDVAEILVWVASRPPHVNIDEMLIKPVDQETMYKIYRRPKG